MQYDSSQPANLNNIPNDVFVHTAHMLTGQAIAVYTSVSRQCHKAVQFYKRINVNEFYRKRNFSIRQTNPRYAERDLLHLDSRLTQLTVYAITDSYQLPMCLVNSLITGFAFSLPISFVRRLQHLTANVLSDYLVPHISNDILTLHINNNIDYSRFVQLRSVRVVADHYNIYEKLHQLANTVTTLHLSGGPYVSHLFDFPVLTQLRELKLRQVCIFSDYYLPQLNVLSVFSCGGRGTITSKAMFLFETNGYDSGGNVHEALVDAIHYTHISKEVRVYRIPTDEEYRSAIRHLPTNRVCTQLTFGGERNDIDRAFFIGSMRVVFNKKLRYARLVHDVDEMQ